MNNTRRTRLVFAFVLSALFVEIIILLSNVTVEDSTIESLRNLDVEDKVDKNVEQQEQQQETTTTTRILYIVTSLAEYQNGRRFTTRGDDRLVNFMLPALVEGVESMLSLGYHVDVYLITHWRMRHGRRQLIRDSLPPAVGLDVWDNATPIGYKLENKHDHVDAVTRGLARQHRYVIKDKLLDYDLFVNFEDDMIVKGEHVQHYLEMSNTLHRLRASAPTRRRDRNKRHTHMRDIFYGELQQRQFDRLFPGFMRVEVIRDENRTKTQRTVDPIPIDLDFDDGMNRTVDPRPCCHVSNKTANDHIPQSPSSDRIFIWETGIKGLSVREIPGMGWVGLQSFAYVANYNRCVGNYWSGRDGDFGTETRPNDADPKYLSNQGGWMATRQQILEWHTEQCPCSFLPPYDGPCYWLDGLDLRNVEYWSGGFSLFQSFQGCNLQRIVSLDPDGFSRHLLYHSSNNKQRQLTQHKKSERFVKVDDLLGQLNTVKKRAQDAKRREMAEV